MPKIIEVNCQLSVYACGKQAQMAVRDAVKHAQMHRKVCSTCKNAEVEVNQAKLEKRTGKKMVSTFVIE